ncbi:MAG TPA: polysaccharide biosynthesis tyrosine autokinase [Acidobacteriaceae bacterium]
MSKSSATPEVGAARQTHTDSQELSVGDILLTVRHRRRLLLITIVACLALAVTYLLLAPKKYTATATIEINKDNSMSLGLDDLSGIGSKLGTGADLLTDMMTHESDLENESTALDVIKRTNLLSTEPYAVVPGKSEILDREHGLPIEKAPATRDHAIAIFKRRLHVDLVKNTRLIAVSYTDTDPNRAAAVANTIVEVYLANHTEARYAASLKTSNWLTTQLAELKDRVAESERKVSQFQQKSGLVGVYVTDTGKGSADAGLPHVSSVEDERLLALNNELTQAEVGRIAKEALYRFAQTGDPDVLASLGSSSLVTGAAGSTDPSASAVSRSIATLQSLRQQQTLLKLQYASDITKYGPRNPELMQVNNQLTSIAGEIQSELLRIRQGTKSDFDIAALAEKNLRAKVGDQEKVVGRLDQSIAGLMVLEQESASNRLLYQDLYTRLEEANLAAGLGAGMITISDPARSSSKPSAPIPLEVLAIGLGAGLLLGVSAALLLDNVQNILYTPGDFHELLPFAELGMIPDFSSAQRRRRYGSKAVVKDPVKIEGGRVAWLLRDPTSPVSEAFRQFRTSVLMSKSASPPRTLLFTSAVSGDGKTVSSFNLATAFAYQGSRVLILDADLRRPSMHTLFGCSGAVGLSNVLTGAISTADAILAHPEMERLFLLPAGTIPPMPAELLGSKRFSELLAECQGSYDYVIIDTPPMLLVTDPLLLAPMVEGVILVARAGRDTRPAVKQAITMLSRPQVRVLGYVLNGVSAAPGYYRYEGAEA